MSGVVEIALDTDDKMPILERLARAPFPDHWNMVAIPWKKHARSEMLRKWILQNLSGRFGFVQINSTMMLIFLESPSDFMRYNLIDGTGELAKIC